MPLASTTWDSPPDPRLNLSLVGCGEVVTAKPKIPSIERSTLFLCKPDEFSMTLVRQAGRLDGPSAVSLLDLLKGLPPDWNGYGAQPINAELIEQAKRFIERLPDDIVDAPAVVPMTRGRLQLEWHRGNRSLELEFVSKGRIHYLKADDDSGTDEENILLTDQAFEIEELLRWFSSE